MALYALPIKTNQMPNLFTGAFNENKQNKKYYSPYARDVPLHHAAFAPEIQLKHILLRRNDEKTPPPTASEQGNGCTAVSPHWQRFFSFGSWGSEQRQYTNL